MAMKNQEIAFLLIAKNGAARSMFVEALERAKVGDFLEAKKCMEEGEALLVEGHEEHGKLITRMARGEEILMDLLLVHAEDQMMAAETFKVLCKELIVLHEEMQELKRRG